MSAEGPKAFPVVYDADNGLQYSFQTGYVTIPGAPLNAITALTGDVTATGPGSVAATIAALAVTSAKLANGAVTPAKISTVATDDFIFPNEIVIQGQSGGGSAILDFFNKTTGAYRIVANTGSAALQFYSASQNPLTLQNNDTVINGNAKIAAGYLTVGTATSLGSGLTVRGANTTDVTIPALDITGNIQLEQMPPAWNNSGPNAGLDICGIAFRDTGELAFGPTSGHQNALVLRTNAVIFESGNGIVPWVFGIGENTNCWCGDPSVANHDTWTPASKLNVIGNMTIGSTYAGDATGTAAPANGLLVEGNVAIGQVTASSPLTVNGVIESKSGGVKFPDGTTQTTAATGGGSTPNVVQSTAAPISTTSSGSFVDTGLSAAITLAASTSRVKITFACSSELATSGTGPTVYYTIVRDGINLFSYNDAAISRSGTDVLGPTNFMDLTINGAYVDSPAASGAHTYKIQQKTSSGSGTASNVGTETSVLIVEEILG